MKIEILEPGDLSVEELDALTTQNVILRDWNYMIVAPLRVVVAVGKPARKMAPLGLIADVARPEVVWYQGIFRGRRRALGVGYHEEEKQ